MSQKQPRTPRAGRPRADPIKVGLLLGFTTGLLLVAMIAEAAQ